MPSLVRARTVFEAVIDLPVQERIGRARDLCLGDPALFEIVSSMLELDGSALALDTADGLSVPLVLAAQVLDFDVPDRLGQYRILRELGRGGMGIVYEGEQELPRRRVALKTLPVLSADLGLGSEAFGREVDAMARTDHPGIPRIYEVFVHEGRPVVAMELVSGEDIVTALEGRPRADRLRVLERLCEALHAAHEAGVVHRDLKPSNVLLDEWDQPRVLDFGIASLTGEGAAGAGTLDFAAPEQLRGDPPDVRMDVYGLGVLAHSALLGELPAPSARDRDQALAAKAAGPTGAVDGLPMGLRAVLLCALAPDPSDRYATARALGQDLARVRRGLPVRVLSSRRAYVVATWAKRNLWVAPLVLLGAVAALLLGSGLVWVVQAAAEQVRSQRAEERLTRLQSDALAMSEARVAAAFEAFIRDPDHDGTPAVSQASLWRAEQLSGREERRRMLLAAWTTATRPAENDRALTLLAEVLAEEGRWDPLHHVLQLLPADAVPVVRLRHALVTGDVEQVRVHLPAQHSAVLQLLSGGTRLGDDFDENRDVEISDGHVLWTSHTGRVELDALGHEVSRIPADNIERFVLDPDGRPWGVKLASSRPGEVPQLQDRAHGRVQADGSLTPVEHFAGVVNVLRIHDADGDGVPERYFGTGPYSRSLRVAVPPDAPSRPLHAGTENLGSDIHALVFDDLDGDGVDELLVGTFGWQRYDLRVLVDLPEPRLAGRVRIGARQVAVRTPPSGPEIVVAGPVRGSRPLAASAQRMARLRWTGEALSLVDVHDIDGVQGLVTGDMNGDDRADIVVTESGGTSIWLDDGQGGLDAIMLPEMAVRAIGQLDEDPAAEVVARMGGAWWLLGVGDATPPFRPPPAEVDVDDTPEDLSPWLAQRWERASRMAALGLPVDAAAALEPLVARSDRIGELAQLQILRWTEGQDANLAAGAARSLLDKVDEGTALAVHDRQIVERALRAVGDLDGLVRLGVLESTHAVPLVRPDHTAAAVVLERPGEVVHQPGVGLVIRGAAAPDPVVSVPLQPTTGPVAVRARIRLDALDWSGGVVITLVDDAEGRPGQPAAGVKISRGGGGPPEEHRLGLACLGPGPAPSHGARWGEGTIDVSMSILDGEVRCGFDDRLPLHPEGRVRHLVQPRLLIQLEGGNQAVLRADLVVEELDVIGTQPRSTPGEPSVSPTPLQTALLASRRAAPHDPATRLTVSDQAVLLRLYPDRWLPMLAASSPIEEVLRVWREAFYWPAEYGLPEAHEAALSPALDGARLTPDQLLDEAAALFARTRVRALMERGEGQAALDLIHAIERSGDLRFAGASRARVALTTDGPDAARAALEAWLRRSSDVEGAIDIIADDPLLAPWLPEPYDPAPVVE